MSDPPVEKTEEELEAEANEARILAAEMKKTVKQVRPR